MCFGKKQKDNSMNILAIQRADEEKRQERIRQAVAMVNGQFDAPGRQSIYDNQYKAAFDFNKTNLDKGYEDMVKKIQFENLRSGQAGGSAGASRLSKLRERYDAGLQEVERVADRARYSFQNADQGARTNLINLAMGGLDATTAASLANANMRSVSQMNDSSAKQDMLGDWFSDLAQGTAYGAQAAGNRRARNQFAQDYGAYFPTDGNYAGSAV